ncbi:MAG TPA: hypothetical protein VEF04_16805 [Blastocatellia bacterium]|nr:hypothetical protein [Blastocatellia bacterium]
MNRKYAFNISSLLFILIVAVWAVGCASSENKTSEATTSPSPSATAAATASPAATVAEAKVDVAGAWAQTKEHLEMAATELKNKNTRGAVDHLAVAQKELASVSDNAPVTVKSVIDAAGKQIETAKSLVEKNDATASAALTKATDLVSKAADLAKTTGGIVDATKSASATPKSEAAGAAKQPEKK